MMKKTILLLVLLFSLFVGNGQKFFGTYSYNKGYGLLYNWFVTQPQAGGANIAPAGWHVPTKAEWETLLTTLGGSSVAGGKMKMTGFLYWSSPNTGADNSSGFFAKGSGHRVQGTGLYQDKNITSYTWCVNNYYGDGSTGYVTYLKNDIASVYMFAADNNYGFAIRLVKNDPNSWAVGDMVSDADGNSYPTVKIGGQVWIAKNWASTRYNDNTSIPNVTDNNAWKTLTTGAWCVLDNDLKNK